MYTSQLNHIKTENTEWIKTLDLMYQECIQMKTRLSKLIEQHDAPAVIDHAEQFQNQILLKEAAVDILKQDVRVQADHINFDIQQGEVFVGGKRSEKQEQIRQQITYLENDFFQMRAAFDDYVQRHMQMP